MKVKNMVCEVVKKNDDEIIARLKNPACFQTKSFLIHILKNNKSYCDTTYRNLSFRLVCEADFLQEELRVHVVSANNKIDVKYNFYAHSNHVMVNWNQILNRILYTELPKLYKENPDNFKFKIF